MMNLSRMQAVLLDMDGTLVDSDGAVERSWRTWATEYRVDPGHEMKALLYDPQTSGGLFLLVPEAEAAALLAELPEARAIGRARARGERSIVIV